MKVTKYPQSCLVLEKQGSGRVLIDPGNLAIDIYELGDFGPVDAVLYTHRHADHCDPRLFDDLREGGVDLYGNADVCEVVGEGITEVADGEAFDVAGFSVLARDLPHVEMVDGSAGPPNTGFLVDGTLFHPGDGLELEGLRVDDLALPIAGPSISFARAYAFAERTGADRVIPIHYDFFVADPNLFGTFFDLAELIVLDHGDSTEL